MAAALAAAPDAALAGIYTHGGHSYDADDVDAVRAIGATERDVTVGFASRLRERGLDCPIVGVGSTPTANLPPDHLDGVDEMHPGNYVRAAAPFSSFRNEASEAAAQVFNDTTQSILGSATESDIAVRVLTRIIGHYPATNMLLIDLGW